MRARTPSSCRALLVLAALFGAGACGGDEVYVPVPKQRPGATAITEPLPAAPEGPTPAPAPQVASRPSSPAPSCATDACFRRELDVAGRCAVVESFGRAVYEKHDGGWGYDFVQAPDAVLAFRVIAEDHPLHLLHAPAVAVKMLSDDPDESSSCDWCLCATDCAFRRTGVIIATSRDRLPGTVLLQRYGDGSKDQRESLAPPLPEWQPNAQFHGYVCPPEPPAA